MTIISDHELVAEKVIKDALICHYLVAETNANPLSLEKDTSNTGL